MFEATTLPTEHDLLPPKNVCVQWVAKLVEWSLLTPETRFEFRHGQFLYKNIYLLLTFWKKKMKKRPGIGQN